ncbi:serine/threonine-protein kinase ULK1 isoform X2 [Stegostoma tigrinum]|uniref:serine/threonine-protein kinase ULK1 isoform X2 n=1 Tax=Stegostoma tigrinum TaxID=3053191 RepID=UPI0028709C3D|nr:serine/threonine-protein kinase ULK1 isoform X2 [Stegostoma tigrinum]
MESVGKFEFNRQDLIGHGAFAVVFKGRYIEKHDWEVAIKCINKKNLAKSQTLLGKEIKILKELKHDNIVALYDFQEMASSVYLVMEYCNGGDLADYLHSKGTLSEDTIRLFLQQIAGAMKMLHSKGVIHRDLKPQNILLSCTAGRKSNPSNIRIKIADFGFARYLQTNMLAATLCGSPMYMAPEVIMSQHYDAKADLWSIGTIVYQCLTGKAPFQANSPQNLRLLYEKNKNLVPNIPRETSSHLRHLLLGLLLRNHKDRMEFSEFFHHPFLDASSSMKKSAPVPMPVYASSASTSSCTSSSTSHLASSPSLADVQQLSEKALASPTQESPAFLQVDSGGSSSKNSSCDIDDFVLVPYNTPTQYSGELLSDTLAGRTLIDSLNYSSGSALTSTGLGSHGRPSSPSASCSSSTSPSGRPSQESISGYGDAVPIPVPTQILNYQRIEQNLQSPKPCSSPRPGSVRRPGSTSPLGFNRTGLSPPCPGEQASNPFRRSTSGSLKPFSLSPQVGTIPEQLDQFVSATPIGSETRVRHTLPGLFPTEPHQHRLGSRLHSAPNLSDTHQCQHKMRKQYTEPVVTCIPQNQPLQPCRQMRSSPKLSELIQRSPLPTIVGSPTKVPPLFEFSETPGSPNLVTLLTHQGLSLASTRNRTVPTLSPLQNQHINVGLKPVDEMKEPFGRSLSAGKLSDLLLKAAFGGPTLDPVSSDSLNTEKPMDITAAGPPRGCVSSGTGAAFSSSPAPVVFTVGSPPSDTSPCSGRTRMFSVGSSSSMSSVGSSSSRVFQCSPAGASTESPPAAYEGPFSLRCTYPDTFATNIDAMVTFEAPELPEETLMEEHTEILKNLRFTLVFVHCVMEIASAKGNPFEMACSSVNSANQLQESMVADQISLLSKEWSYAEQLVLYMKVTELLASALHMSKNQIKAGKLCPSSTVKQVVKKLNKHYKSCVSHCRCLTVRLQRFFIHKQRLMDRINSITAAKLIYSHTVQMVQSTALDEMFQQGEDCIQRYHKALLLMEGLSQIITEQEDVDNISKCKQSIERRLSALQPGLCA